MLQDAVEIKNSWRYLIPCFKQLTSYYEFFEFLVAEVFLIASEATLTRNGIDDSMMWKLNALKTGRVIRTEFCTGKVGKLVSST